MSAKRHKALRRAAKELTMIFAEAGALHSGSLELSPANDEAKKNLREYIRTTDPKSLVDDPRQLFNLAESNTLVHNKHSARGILKTLKKTAKIKKD